MVYKSKRYQRIRFLTSPRELLVRRPKAKPEAEAQADADEQEDRGDQQQEEEYGDDYQDNEDETDAQVQQDSEAAEDYGGGDEAEDEDEGRDSGGYNEEEKAEGNPYESQTPSDSGHNVPDFKADEDIQKTDMMSEEETKPAIKEEVEEEEENEEEENEKNRQEVKVEVKKEDESEGADEKQQDDQHEQQHGQDTAGQPEQDRTEDMSKWKRLTDEDKKEIVLMSGERSSRVIAADFNQRHPERPPISHSTVFRVLAKFRETGSV